MRAARAKIDQYFILNFKEVLWKKSYIISYVINARHFN